MLNCSSVAKEYIHFRRYLLLANALNEVRPYELHAVQRACCMWKMPSMGGGTPGQCLPKRQNAYMNAITAMAATIAARFLDMLPEHADHINLPSTKRCARAHFRTACDGLWWLEVLNSWQALYRPCSLPNNEGRGRWSIRNSLVGTAGRALPNAGRRVLLL